MTTFKWIGGILIALVILVILHWFLISRPNAYFNQYGKDLIQTASTTPTDSSNTGATTTSDAAASNVGSQTAAVVNAPSASTSNTISNSTKNLMHKVTIETSKGTIVFETYDADAPNTVKNFITLADKGFYNGIIFHRIIDGFMIQGGDPTGTGSGGPGYQFSDELNSSTPSYKAGYVRGTVAMANAGPNTNGSQFFIVQKDTALPHSYTIFGKVISGMEVVDAIAKSPKNASDKPLTDIKMTKVTVKTN